MVNSTTLYRALLNAGAELLTLSYYCTEHILHKISKLRLSDQKIRCIIFSELTLKVEPVFATNYEFFVSHNSLYYIFQNEVRYTIN